MTASSGAPVRVVHLITGLAIGGTEIQLLRTLANMDRSSVENTVVSMTRDGPMASRIRAAGITVHELGMRRGIPDPVRVWQLRRLLRAERPHVLQTWLYHADLLGMAAARLAGVPHLAWNVRCSVTDDRYSRGLGGWVLRTLARLSPVPDAVVVNSRAGREMHESIGYRPRRWVLIPNGFEPAVFQPDPAARTGVRRELGLAEETPLVGLVARWDPTKDHATFLRAALDLAQTRPDARFVLVGGGVDAHNSALSALIAELGLASRVHLLGERADVPRLTAALDVATCSSIGEGFPNAVGEAMACGIVVVSTDVGDTATVLLDSGVVVPPYDPAGLADGWRTVLAMAPAERAALGRRARERVIEQYDAAGIAARYAALYRELAAAGPAAESRAA